METARRQFGASGTLTKEAAAELLQCSQKTVDRRIAARRIWAKTDDLKVLIDRQSVLDYLGNLPTKAEDT